MKKHNVAAFTIVFASVILIADSTDTRRSLGSGGYLSSNVSENRTTSKEVKTKAEDVNEAFLELSQESYEANEIEEDRASDYDVMKNDTLFNDKTCSSNESCEVCSDQCDDQCAL